MRPSVLHITAHLGQGIGKALVGAMVSQDNAASPYLHHVLCLDRPEKLDYVIELQQAGINVDIQPDKQHLDKLINSADIIQFEWWHHPLLSELLATHAWNKGRYIFWCHVAGNEYPVIPDALPEIAHRFVLTSPISLISPAIQNAIAQCGHAHTPIIPSVGNFHVVEKKLPIDPFFHIGYCGTLSYVKMHPALLQVLAKNIPTDYRYHFAGDLPKDHNIIAEAEKLGFAEQIQFHGFVSPVESFLASLDVFVYILQPKHYGTTENALLEAMAAGLPVIAMNQGVEKNIIEHGKTGILLDNIEELPQTLEWLRNHPAQAKEIASNARQHIAEFFNADTSRNKFNSLYNEVLDSSPKEFNPTTVLGPSPYSWFLAGQPEERRRFYQDWGINSSTPAPSWNVGELGDSKSSARQYHSFFRHDTMLTKIANFLPALRK